MLIKYETTSVKQKCYAKNVYFALPLFIWVLTYRRSCGILYTSVNALML